MQQFEKTVPEPTQHLEEHFLSRVKTETSEHLAEGQIDTCIHIQRVKCEEPFVIYLDQRNKTPYDFRSKQAHQNKINFQ